MQTSESIKLLSGALVKAQKDLSNPAMTGTNPHFKSSYATLPAILDHVRPVLAKHGLAVVQSVDSEEIGSARIVTRIIHESGEYLESDALLMRGQKPDAHGTGSAITYGRRYSLLAMLGIAGDDDDDGQGAVAKNGGDKKPAADTPKTKAKTRKELFLELAGMCADHGISEDAVKGGLLNAYKKSDPAKLTVAEFQRAIDGLDEFVKHTRNFVADNGGLLD